MASASDEKTALLARSSIGRSIERMREFGVDVEEHLHVGPAEIAAQARGRSAIGAPQPHVGSKQPGEDLAHEARARRGADGDAGERDPRDS